MKVLQVTNVDFSLRHFLMPLMLAARARGHEVVGVCADGPLLADVRAAGLRVEALPLARSLSPVAQWRAFWSLVRLIRMEQSGPGAWAHADQRVSGEGGGAGLGGAACRLHVPRVLVQSAGALVASGAGVRDRVGRRATDGRVSDGFDRGGGGCAAAPGASRSGGGWQWAGPGGVPTGCRGAAAGPARVKEWRPSVL